MNSTQAGENRKCFVIMPISDSDGYEEGHFRRVYEYVFRPACKEAGFESMRADDVRNTNYIIIDILRRILESDIVLCDLSGKNPNVLYELGIRQAFNLPVVLVKDRRTKRVFDIQGMRTLEYEDALRVDTVQVDTKNIRVALEETFTKSGQEINSIIQLLGIAKAELSDPQSLTPDSALLLSAIRDVAERITALENRNSWQVASRPRRRREVHLPSGEKVSIGDVLYDEPGGEKLGELLKVDESGIWVNSEEGGLIIPPDDPRFDRVSFLPF